MSVKFSELPSASVLDDANLFPLVADISGTLTSEKSTLAILKNYVLAGNAATATKLATPITINGVTFDGSASIVVTVPLTAATNSVLGAIKVGAGLQATVDGTLSITDKKLFHGFSVNTDGDLIYSTTTDTSISLQDQYGADIYEDTDMGTNDYAYSMDANGNLIVTFS